MRRELDKAKSTLEETQNELSAWKFTPDRLLLILESRLWCRRDDDGRQWTRVGAPTASVFCASRRYSTCWCPSLSDGVGVGCLPTKGPEWTDSFLRTVTQASGWWPSAASSIKRTKSSVAWFLRAGWPSWRAIWRCSATLARRWKNRNQVIPRNILRLDTHATAFPALDTCKQIKPSILLFGQVTKIVIDYLEPVISECLHV